MSNYTVVWKINLEANSAEQAAQQAFNQMRASESSLNKCEVYDNRAGVRVDVDISKLPK